jgi:hypothetical protein
MDVSMCGSNIALKGLVRTATLVASRPKSTASALFEVEIHCANHSMTIVWHSSELSAFKIAMPLMGFNK